MLKPTTVVDIPTSFEQFCQRIGATFTGCNSNGGLLVVTWTGAFTCPDESNIPAAFWRWCDAIEAGFAGIVLGSGLQWTATFTTKGAGGIIPPITK